MVVKFPNAAALKELEELKGCKHADSQLITGAECQPVYSGIRLDNCFLNLGHVSKGL